MNNNQSGSYLRLAAMTIKIQRKEVNERESLTADVLQSGTEAQTSSRPMPEFAGTQE